MDYPRRELINHVAGKDNLCLGLGRQGIAVNDSIWYLIQVSPEPIDANVFRRGGINVFPITEFVEKSDKTVAAGHPKYSKGEVHINKQGDCFKGVSEEVWNFYIGGYQVCHKWLKDRKNRTLSDEDILHYQKIVVALAETIKLMQLIDTAIPSFPIE